MRQRCLEKKKKKKKKKKKRQANKHKKKPSPLSFDRISDGWPVPDFTLIDQHGDALTRHRLLGQWTFVLFGDTQCAAPCTNGLKAP